MKNFIPTVVFLLAFFIFFASCNDVPLPIVKFNPDLNKPDTAQPIIFSTYTSNTYPAIFEAAFINETKVRQEAITYTFINDTIGNIKIESGKIIACDPIVMRHALPFIETFPIGEFPVQLALAKFGIDQRVAFSRILFSTNQIKKWGFALKKGQQPLPLGDSVYCYGVDGGIGMFIDSVANENFNKLDDEHSRALFEKTGFTGLIYNFNNHNLATFSSGFGDGCYATYIGFDKNENICQLLTDFGIFDWWKGIEKK